MEKTPTLAYAKAGTKEKSFIPKYGDSPNVLVANFAINI